MDAKIFKTLHVKAVQRDTIIAPQIKKIIAPSKVAKGMVSGPNIAHEILNLP